MNVKLTRSVVIAASLMLSPALHAGMYTDDLARCLVSSTTADDKVSLVVWMFSAASLHPAVSSIATVTKQQLDVSNKKTAELFVKLISETCKEQAQKAVKYEGQVAIQASFQVLGQVAAAELFSNPQVTASMAELDKYVDKAKLEQTFKEDL